MRLQVFQHVVDMPGWYDIWKEQVDIMISSGLIDAANVTMCLNGDIESFVKIFELAKEYDNIIVEHTHTDFTLCEYPTIDAIKKWSHTFDDEAYVCYFHLKGVSHEDKNGVKDWRNRINHHIIRRWYNCVSALESGFDAVGIDDNTTDNPSRFFSGNFWWAKSSYIRRLPFLSDPRNLNDNDISPYTGHNYSDVYKSFRYDYEYWIYCIEEDKCANLCFLKKEFF